MDNVFVYVETEGTLVQEVSQELLTKGRKLANTLSVELHAVVAGTGIRGNVEDQILPYGVDKLFDMGRTTLNIVGDASCAVVVSKIEEKRMAKKA